MKQRKVLFIGTPGIRREYALQSILNAAHTYFSGQRIFTAETGQIPLFERYLYENPVTFLSQPEIVQRAQWRKAFDDVNKEFSGSRTDHFLLSLHLSYRFQEIPSIAADFLALKEWKPDCIITFIDDAYCVQRRIEGSGYRGFSLHELLLWRSEEILLGDMLARIVDPVKPPPNYVVSVKHPAASVVRLIMQPELVTRFYLSYNITNSRKTPEDRAVIDNFRLKMHEQKKAFSFDPLTIDELPPLYTLTNDREQRVEYNLGRADTRWPPLVVPEHLEPLVKSEDMEEMGSWHISREELEFVKNAMRAQVKNRDFRLIDQSHYLVIYRPTMHGTPAYSQGVAAELTHARATNCRTVTYVKKGVDRLPESPLMPHSHRDDPNFMALD